MKSPWDFDGRNMVDVAEMERLGFCVEVIGKARVQGQSIGSDRSTAVSERMEESILAEDVQLPRLYEEAYILSLHR